MKRILSILLVLLLSIFALTGCEGLFDVDISNEDLGLPCVHEYEEVVTAPTCTAKGFTTYTCKICQDTYTDNETAVVAHTYASGVCTVCGAEDPNYVPPVEKDENLESAYNYIHQNVVGIEKVTGATYEVISSATIAGKTYSVVWTVSDDRVSIAAGSDDYHASVVIPKSSEEFDYVLKFTITNEKGESLSREYIHTVPVFTVTSFEDYMAASEGDNVTVMGVVVAINSKAAGNTRNHLFLADLNTVGGYYSYQMEKDPVADLGIEVGMTVIVNGPVTPYSGMQEIKGGIAEIVDTNKTAVDFIDVTEDFANGDNLAKYTALPVVIKGVTIGTQELGGTSEYLFFSLNGHTSYVRTYVTDFPTSLVADDKATIDGAHKEHFDWTADVYGIVVLYNNNPYLIPLSVECFDYLSVVEKTPAEKVAAELANLKVPTKVTSDTTLELGTTGSLYSDVVLTWVSDSEYAVVDGGNVTVTVPDTDTVVTLTLTATCGEASDTKTYTVTLSKTPISITEALSIGSAQEHNTYTAEKYLVAGIITEVYNDTYGNMYIKDAQGNTLTIYGTYSADGSTRYDALEVKPVAGDYVVILGVLGQYNGTAQIKNGWIASHTTSVSVKDASDLGAAQDHNTYTADKYLVTGEVTEIANTTYGNMYIKDAEGNTIYIYGLYDALGATRFDKFTTQPAVGDTITVLSVIGQYNGTAQLKNAWLVDYKAATTGGDSGDSGDGDVELGESTTVNVSIADYATANSWANSTLYATITADGNITITSSGTPVGTYSLNTGKFYSSDNTWRIYQNESPSVVISAKDGYVIVSVKISYNVKNTGTLTLGTENIASGTTVTVNASSVTFGVGNTGDKTNGQAQITAIEVVYAPIVDGDTPSCEHTWGDGVVTAPTCEAAGYTTYTCTLCGDTKKDNEVAATGHTPGDAATCLAAQVCTVCSKELVGIVYHTYEDGVCTVCGDKEPVSVSAPVADKAYKFGFVQVSLAKNLYVTGEVSGRYLSTTDDADAAADVYVAAVDGGYMLYIVVDGANKYIEVYFNESDKLSVQYSDNGSVFAYNAEVNAWVTNLDGTDYYVGTYSTYGTLSASKLTYISADNTGKTQFPANLYEFNTVEEEHTHTYTDGVCSCGLLQGGTYDDPQALTGIGDFSTAYPGGYNLNWFSITGRQSGYFTVSSTYASAWLKIGTDVNAASSNDGSGSVKVYIPAGTTCYIGVADWNEAEMEVPFTVSFEAFTSEPIDSIVGTWVGEVSGGWGSYISCTIVIDENGLGTYTEDGGYYEVTYNITTVLLSGSDVTIIATDSYGNQPSLTTFVYDSEADTLGDFVRGTAEGGDEVDPDVTYDTVLYAGENTVYASADEISLGSATRTLVIEEAGNYSFAASLLVKVYSLDGTALTAVSNVYTLEAGTYNVVLSMFSLMGYEADDAISITVTKKVVEEEGEADGSEDNPYVIESLPTEVVINSDTINKTYYLFTTTEAGYVIVTYSTENDSWVDIFNVADGEDSSSKFQTTSATFAVAASATYRLGLGTWANAGEVTITVKFVTELGDASCEHSYSSYTSVYPTCVSTGTETYTCDLCGHVYTEELPIDSTNHNYWTDWSSVVYPTCQTDGYEKLECQNCGDVKEEITPASTDYCEWETDYSTYKAPTCIEAGYMFQTCSVCGGTRELTPAAADWYHSYELDEATYVAPTCTTAGYEKYVCTYCGDSYEETLEPEHNYNYGSYIVSCEGCGDYYFSFSVMGSGNDYSLYVYRNYMGQLIFNVYDSNTWAFDNYYSYVVTSEADGVYTLTLTANGDDYLGLNSAVAIVTVADDGITVNITTLDGAITYTFSDIEEAGSEEEEPEAADGTIDNPYVIDSLPFGIEIVGYHDVYYTWTATEDCTILITYTEGSYVSLSCSFDKDSENLVYTCTVSAGEVVSINPWVTSTAATGYTYTITFAEEETCAHNTTSISSTDATCTTDGYYTVTCDECGEVVHSETTPATGHTYEAAVTDPTCTVDGYTTYTCACGDSYTADVVTATGHTGYEADYQCDTCSAIVAPEADSVLTIEQAIMLGELHEKNAYTDDKYYVTGTITSVYNTTYGNMYITDGNGNELCIYGTYSADGTTKYGSLDVKPVVGDTVTVYGIIGYYSSAQMKNGWITAHTAHEHAYSEATCKTPATCSICGGIDGTILDHDYVNGVCTMCGAEDPSVSGAIVTSDDFSTVTTSSSYASGTTTNGWTYTNAAILASGTVSCMDSSYKAVTLNGKTTAVGTVVSPTVYGISAISFNYTNAFSESNGVDITITITDTTGIVVATNTLDNDSVTKNTAYTYEWIIDETLSGEYTITITNNSPTASTSNKDRVSIWNIQITSPAA